MNLLKDVKNSMSIKTEKLNAEKEKAYKQMSGRPHTCVDASYICNYVNFAATSRKEAGYTQALNEILDDLDDRDLKELYLRYSDTKAGNTLALKLRNKGYLEKDNEGYWKKTGRWNNYY